MEQQSCEEQRIHCRVSFLSRFTKATLTADYTKLLFHRCEGEGVQFLKKNKQKKTPHGFMSDHLDLRLQYVHFLLNIAYLIIIRATIFFT